MTPPGLNRVKTVVVSHKKKKLPTLDIMISKQNNQDAYVVYVVVRIELQKIGK